MNLCTNSAYAMEDTGGLLTITLSETTLRPDDPAMTSGDYIQLMVSDTGTGIAEEDIKNIFNPYFTTKPTGEGTGLGLSVVHGIVKSFGGDITVESKIGICTTFNVYLPIFKKRIKSENKPELSKSLPRGTERILVVDDEPALVKMIKLHLEKHGYTVESFTSSTEVVELIKKRPNDFDLVITDMTMPEMTGDKMAIEIMKICPSMPVIMCTGYSKKISEELAVEIGIKCFATKPIDLNSLLLDVRKLVDEQKSIVEE
jgi:two-component system cell cycle sensor histidine kinase/response regulator CckA